MSGQKVHKHLFPNGKVGPIHCQVLPGNWPSLPGGHLVRVEAAAIWGKDPGEAKVCYLELARGTDEQVGWFQVLRAPKEASVPPVPQKTLGKKHLKAEQLGQPRSPPCAGPLPGPNPYRPCPSDHVFVNGWPTPSPVVSQTLFRPYCD